MGSLPKELYFILFGAATLSIGTNAILPILPLFMIEVGTSELEIGLILAISSMLGLASRVPISILSKRVGRKTMVITAFMVQFTTLMSLGFVDDVFHFYLLLTLNSMLWALYAPFAIALVSDMASTSEIGKIMGIYYTSIGLGSFLGPLLSGFLGELLSYRHVFLVLSILPVIGLCASTRLEGKTSERRNESDNITTNIGESFRRILKSRNIIGLSLSRLSFFIAVGVVRALFSVWAQNNLLFSTSMISILFSARGLANLLIRFPTGKLVDRAGMKKPILLAFCIGAIGFLLLSFTTDFWLLFLGMGLFGLAWGMRIVPDTAIMTVSVSPEDKVLAFAFVMSMPGIGTSIGSFVSGLSYTIFPMSVLFQISSAVIIIGLITLIVMIDERSQTYPTDQQ